MNKEKLDALLASGAITQEEYDKLIESLGLKEDTPEGEPEETKEDDTLSESERLDRLIQARVDKAISKLGKEKAALQKQLEAIKREKLSDEQVRELEAAEREKALEERERALLESENRMYALKAIKAAGLDDGGENAIALVDFVLSDETTEIDSKVKAFGELVRRFTQAEVKKTFKDNGRNPQGGGKPSAPNNPWAAETFNLTEQMRLEIEDPELAQKFKSAVSK